MIAIVDFGVCNVGSVANMLRRAGSRAHIARTASDLEDAGKIILPGIGHFDAGMRELEARGLIEAIRHHALERGRPLLGICLGMQLLGRGSEEGEQAGLNLVPIDFVKFDPSKMPDRLPVPHMGWNDVTMSKPSPLLRGLETDSRFYFVHSYHAVLERPDDSLLACHYGYPFIAAYEHDNIAGVQFHPEKSHVFGRRLLQNFAEL